MIISATADCSAEEKSYSTPGQIACQSIIPKPETADYKGKMRADGGTVYDRRTGSLVWNGGADGTRTRDLRRDRPAF